MRCSNRRGVAVIGALVALFALVLAGPASAEEDSSPTNCLLLLAGPTPSVEIDTNDDGVPEVRVQSISNVTVCAGADVVFTDSPTIRSEQCGPFASCMAFRIHYGLSGYAQTGVQFCYSADGSPNCTYMPPLRIPFDFLAPGNMCVGYDLRGGFPCSGGQPISFE
jgi:hypothetical protein